MADNHSKEVRSYNMSQIRSTDSKPEVIVRKFLFSHGFRYRKNDKRYPGRPDIVLPKYKTIIFVNGCFWHGHESCKYFVLPKTNTDYWSKKIQNNIRRDRSNIRFLESQGWNVIVIWECELKPKIRENSFKKLLANLNTQCNKEVNHYGNDK